MIQEVVTMPQVKIRIEKGVQTAGDGQEQQEQKNRNTQGLNNVAVATAFAHTMINTGKQIITYSFSNVGQFTGNNLKQDQINTALEILGDVGSIAAGIATSVISENPVPLFASIMSIGTKYGLRSYSEYQEFKHGEYQRNLLLERSGNSTTNGSRGTEN